MSKKPTRPATDPTPPPTIETPAESTTALTPQQLLGGEPPGPDADRQAAPIPPEEIQLPDDDAGAEIRRGSGGKTVCSKCGKHRPFTELTCSCVGPVRLEPMSEQLPPEPRIPATPPHLYGRMPSPPSQFFGENVPALRAK